MTTDLALLILRLALGLFLVAHGAQKLFGWFGGHGLTGTRGWLAGLGLKPAGLWAFAAGIGEFAGGLSLALGLLTPLGAVLIAATMTTAMALAHWPKILVTEGGIEYPLVLALTTIAVAVVGPGAYSLDTLLGLALPAPVTLAAALLAVLGVALALLNRRQPVQQPAN